MSQTTLIKWPGGKSKEYKEIRDLIPKFSRYIEPFFGGGAVFFQLKPEQAIINDCCKELIEFYRFIKGEYNRAEFHREVYSYVDHWERISAYLKTIKENILTIYFDASKSRLEFNQSIKQLINQENLADFFNQDFAIDLYNLAEEISNSLFAKILRMQELETRLGKLAASDLERNIETGIRSGFYTHFRNLMNDNTTQISHAKRISNYYFIREFCYGAMFRFNASGAFNIPYGGIAYNQKDFRSKVDYIMSADVTQLFKNTQIIHGDFQSIFNSLNLNQNDFIFLDPPYDSDFSDYENKSFGQQDQQRLAECLYNCLAKFLLVIKKTDFIQGLYQDRPNIKIASFKKTYLYNVRGRNDREVEHLVVYNY